VFAEGKLIDLRKLRSKSPFPTNSIGGNLIELYPGDEAQKVLLLNDEEASKYWISYCSGDNKKLYRDILSIGNNTNTPLFKDRIDASVDAVVGKFNVSIHYIEADHVVFYTKALMYEYIYIYRRIMKYGPKCFNLVTKKEIKQKQLPKFKGFTARIEVQ
jgi:hypothetical protein